MADAVNIRNYDFIPFSIPNTCYSTDKNTDMFRHRGYMDIKFTAVSPIYTGSGFFAAEKEGFIFKTMKSDGKFIIPGSSVKGAVRTVCSAVSDGCIKADRIKREYKNSECSMKSNKSICIICDMFGNINPTVSSKISFSDFKSENAVSFVKILNQQFSPQSEKGWRLYTEKGFYKGYKFYFSHSSDKYTPKPLSGKKVNIEAVKEGAEFIGRINFKKLSDDELALLVYALGLDGDFVLKLGGFKSEGMGEVKTECIRLVINENESDISNYIGKYRSGYGKKFTDKIKKLQEIQTPVKEAIANAL